MMNLDKVKGAFYGAVIGDVMGVPFEFKSPTDIEEIKNIDIDVQIPDKTYPNEPYGVWSDDSSLMFALCDALNNQESWLSTFRKNALTWRYDGAYTSTGKKFDIGIATASAMNDWEENPDLSHVAFDPDNQGNGALMRTLPCAFLDDAPRCATYAIMHTAQTHNSPKATVISLLMSLTVFFLVRNYDLSTSIQRAVGELESSIFNDPDPGQKGTLGEVLEALKDASNYKGTGWCIDTFGSAMYIAHHTSDPVEAIRNAIRLGNDTDTTAAVAGAIAGAIHGYTDSLAERRVKIVNYHLVDDVWNRLEKQLMASENAG